MKVRYLCDPFGTMFDTPEEECANYNRVLAREGLPTATLVSDNELGYIWSDNFDAMIFDWGMGQFGNSLISEYARYLVKCAEDNPSRLFFINSAMTRWAINDAMSQIGTELPNIYFEEEKFFEALRQLGRVGE